MARIDIHIDLGDGNTFLDIHDCGKWWPSGRFRRLGWIHHKSDGGGGLDTIDVSEPLASEWPRSGKLQLHGRKYHASQSGKHAIAGLCELDPRPARSKQYWPARDSDSFQRYDSWRSAVLSGTYHRQSSHYLGGNIE